jgi:hypothetical protein
MTAITSANGSQVAPVIGLESALALRGWDDPALASAAWWWAWKGNGTGELVVTERQLTIFERGAA